MRKQFVIYKRGDHMRKLDGGMYGRAGRTMRTIKRQRTVEGMELRDNKR